MKGRIILLFIRRSLWVMENWRVREGSAEGSTLGTEGSTRVEKMWKMEEAGTSGSNRKPETQIRAKASSLKSGQTCRRRRCRYARKYDK